MSRHEENVSGNGQGELDLSKTKDVQDAGSGRHSGEDRGDPIEDEGDDKK